MSFYYTSCEAPARIEEALSALRNLSPEEIEDAWEEATQGAPMPEANEIAERMRDLVIEAYAECHSYSPGEGSGYAVITGAGSEGDMADFDAVSMLGAILAAAGWSRAD